MIKLKHIKEKDIIKVTQYITSPRVSKFLSWEPYKDKMEIKKYFDYAFTCTSFPDEIFCISFNNETIGTAHLLSRGNKKMQIGFGVLPGFWNKGLGYKIAKELINYIEKSEWLQQTEQVQVVIHKNNIYAQKIFLKLNFFLESKNVKDNFDRYILNL